MTIPDPSTLLSALDAITEKSMKKDQRRLFRVESTRQDTKVDVVTTLEAVEQLSIVLNQRRGAFRGSIFIIARSCSGSINPNG